ncbi:MAG: hypothetical protein ACOX3W_05760 [Christensenellaceae bacterium]
MEHGKEIEEKNATFTIQIKYRQNATWQGSINWAEGKKTENFRSELELMNMIDDVLVREE